jgi:gallate decarboxylase subunit D
MDFNFTRGKGRLGVILQASTMGDGLVVRIFNKNAHIGAVGIGEYDFNNNRASVSVVTRLGHKDDSIAQKAAYSISKSTRKTVCVIAGIHLDGITTDEITQILGNSDYLVEELISQLKATDIPK